MRHSILGIVTGFIVWLIGLLLGILIAWMLWDVMASYFGDLVFLIPILIIAFASLIAGFAAALVAREYTKTPLILSVVLLIVGISFQLFNGDTIELWYYLAFWVLIISMTILGGNLKKILGKFKQDREKAKI